MNFGAAGIIGRSRFRRNVLPDGHAVAAVAQCYGAAVCSGSGVNLEAGAFGQHFDCAFVDNGSAVPGCHAETVGAVDADGSAFGIDDGRIKGVEFGVGSFAANTQHTVAADSSGDRDFFVIDDCSAVYRQHSGMGIGNVFGAFRRNRQADGAVVCCCGMSV